MGISFFEGTEGSTVAEKVSPTLSLPFLYLHECTLNQPSITGIDYYPCLFTSQKEKNPLTKVSCCVFQKNNYQSVHKRTDRNCGVKEVIWAPGDEDL